MDTHGIPVLMVCGQPMKHQDGIWIYREDPVRCWVYKYAEGLYYGKYEFCRADSHWDLHTMVEASSPEGAAEALSAAIKNHGIYMSNQPPMLLGVELHVYGAGVYGAGTSTHSWRGYAGKHLVRVEYRLKRAKAPWTASMDIGRVHLVARAGSWASLVVTFKKYLLQHFTTLPEGFGDRSCQPEIPNHAEAEKRAEMREKPKTVDDGEKLFENLLLKLAENAAVAKWAAQNLLDCKRKEEQAARNAKEAQEKVDACAATHSELMQQLKEVFTDTRSLFDTNEARANNELGQAVGSMPANPPGLGHTLTVRLCGVTTTLSSVPGGWAGLVAPGRAQLTIYPLVDGYLVVLSGQQRVVKAWADLTPEILDLIMRQGAHKRD